jgi:uncharacterized protein involved in exopolysaccharide biosynthesis/Mrp family chromosome partitioning ATPase
MENSTLPPAPGFELGDIYYTLFRHKWKIIICSIIGLAGAAVVYKMSPPPFESEARLFIRYVVNENKSIGPGRDDSTKSIDQRGETILNSEQEVLTSMDLAEQVAKNVGPEKILAGSDVRPDSARAAMTIRGGLVVDVPPRSSIIRITFRNNNAEIVQLVLKGLVESYLKRHLEIHRSAGMMGDFLTQETDQLRARLAQTEEELRKATNKAGIISVEEAKRDISASLSRINQQIFDAQAELARRTAVYQEMTRGMPTVEQTGENKAGVVSPEKIDAYQKIMARVILLRKSEMDALAQFTAETPRVKEIQTQLAQAEEERKKLEADFPTLAQARSVQEATRAPGPGAYDPTMEAANINAIQAEMKVLNSQLDEVKKRATQLDQAETSIMELRRRKELDETNYKFYSASLEQARIAEAYGSGRVSNITVIQQPSVPYQVKSDIAKKVGGAAAGGIALGLAWAFFIELYLDRSVRRNADVERGLHLPLFLSIPKFKDQKAKAKAKSKEAKAAADGLTLAPMPDGSSTTDLVLGTFHETLRDRLISYFESINLRHKPKLVAVTGLGHGTGITTTAAGLARSLSETGEGNVLLVDMTNGQGSAQQFYKGEGTKLDQLFNTRQSAQVQDNLYVVTENSGSERLARSMPQRFHELVPKLKASDFDYIIFDMPPVSQISITPRLAGFMDMVLMVIESEKTDREIAARAASLLAQSKTNVGVVLNKTKHYVPKRLHQDREFLLGT